MNYLQIQKMDLRNAKVTKINDNTFMLEAQITGEAEKIVKKQKELHEPENELYKEILEFKNNNGSTDELVKIVDKLLNMCSDENMNRLDEAIYLSQLNNYVDIPTDCAQRDERLGWMHRPGR